MQSHALVVYDYYYYHYYYNITIIKKGYKKKKANKQTAKKKKKISDGHQFTQPQDAILEPCLPVATLWAHCPLLTRQLVTERS